MTDPKKRSDRDAWSGSSDPQPAKPAPTAPPQAAQSDTDARLAALEADNARLWAALKKLTSFQSTDIIRPMEEHWK